MNQQARPFRPGDHRNVYPGLEDDPYVPRGKLSEPTICSTCGSVYHDGRWQWLARPALAEEIVCPACRRIADRFPGGYVYIEGEFAGEHRAELMQLAYHRAKRAQAEHPMQRIISVDEMDGATIVMTTDPHLAREIGSALKAAYKGTLELVYGRNENLVRVYWRR